MPNGSAMLVRALAIVLMEVAQAEFLTSLSVGGMPPAYLSTATHVKASPQGNALTLQHSSGVSVMSTRDKGTWRPEDIMQFKLLGRTIRFTVDLSGVGCACNIALYLIASPAKDVNGNPSRGYNRDGQPPYYCDAQQIGGQWCPEIDLMEANGRVFSSTPHRCNAPTTHGHYNRCDREGCFTSTKDMKRSYGPGSDYTINTLAPFDVRTEFLERKDTLVGIRTTLEQGERHLVFDHSNCAKHDLASLSSVMRDGMSLRMSYWGSAARTMSWLDRSVCGSQKCSGLNAGDAVISDISVLAAAEGLVNKTENRPMKAEAEALLNKIEHGSMQAEAEALQNNIRNSSVKAAEALVNKIKNSSVKARAWDWLTETDRKHPRDVSVHVLKKFASTGKQLSSLPGSSTHGSLVIPAASACLASFMGVALLIAVSWRLRTRHSPQEFDRQMPTDEVWLAAAAPTPTYDRLPLALHLDRDDNIA